MFLTDEQLADLTGLKQPAAQIRWLQRNGVDHYVRADGKPRVLMSALRRNAAEVTGAASPNFEALIARH